jgi:mevalonate kinase
MPVIFANAPGKIILFGEHAVVYGQPAIAIPVNQLKATARVMPNPSGQPGVIRIQAPQIQLDASLADLPIDHPIAAAVGLAFQAASINQPPAFTLQISSTIPISGGMGSSAAVSIAILRALTNFFGKPLTADQISALAYTVEEIHHGTPSGIDNNVIAHQKPVVYRRDQPIEFLSVKQPTHWVIGDTGETTPTHETVADVRQHFQANPERFSAFFEQIGDISRQAQQGLIDGDLPLLGRLMDQNQCLLEKMGVSSPALEHLNLAARRAGAMGAKLSGGGRGGNMIALAPSENTAEIKAALTDAGAKQVFTTILTKGRES